LFTERFRQILLIGDEALKKEKLRQLVNELALDYIPKESETDVLAALERIRSVSESKYQLLCARYGLTQNQIPSPIPPPIRPQMPDVDGQADLLPEGDDPSLLGR